MNSEVLFCCLSHRCAFMCAVSNEKQFICILNHLGIGSCYFILFIFLKIKQQRLKPCVCRIQRTPPPFPLYIIPLIPSEQKAVPLAMHTSVGGGRWGSVQATSSNSKTSWWTFILGPHCFFSLNEEQGPKTCQFSVCCVDPPSLRLLHWPPLLQLCEFIFSHIPQQHSWVLSFLDSSGELGLSF